MERRLLLLVLLALEAVTAIDDCELTLGSTLRRDPELVAAVTTWAEQHGYRVDVSVSDRSEATRVYRGDYETLCTVYQLASAQTEAA